MKTISRTVLISFVVLVNSCISQFIPQTTEDKKILVVEGLITDLPDSNIIKLSESLPLGTKSTSNPIRGCIVTITDDQGNSFNFSETAAGKYVTDPSDFQGIIGRFYTLHIKTNAANNYRNYESSAMEMKPVPPLDNLYYEKTTSRETFVDSLAREGCQVYLDTHDPTNQCQFYRWEYTETWEFNLPYWVQNKTCWLSNNSNIINIKNTTSLAEARIDRYPLIFISKLTDRLNIKYSIFVKQYSLNEDEYLYWQQLQDITEHVGGLYDIIPSSVTSNVYCLDNPNEKILGYFSVSGSTSKRLFIEDNFAGLLDLYTKCNSDTIFEGEPILYSPNNYWVIILHYVPPPSYIVITLNNGCADCSLRGTTKEPDFWNDDKFP